ncbi:MAG: FAD/NAD(P)-binding protein [Candidatus Saganbacteria bacterium]|nr:FAD/NAD(P)-binding protein [Candidatus Saganbacteria bacterium]
MENPYMPIEAEILDVATESSTIKTFTVRPKQQLKFSAGQFIELTVPGVGEAPFTPSSSPYVKEKIDITIMTTGTITKKLHEMKKGELVGVRGPYGIPYPLQKFYGKEILIVGGGVGLAPLRSLLLALFHEADKFKKIVLKYGARTPEDIIYKSEIEVWKKQKNTEVHISVDVGSPKWKGNVGLVTTLLEKANVRISDSPAIVCGPPIMMKFVTLKLVDLGFPPENIYLSMEKNMSCGIGKCLHCRVGNYYVCKDGPVLTWEQVKDIPDPF